MVATIIASSALAQTPVPKPKTSIDFLPTAFRLFEQMILIVSDTDSLDSKTGSMSQEVKDKIKNDLNKLQLIGLTETERKNIEAYRLDALNYLNNDKLDGFAKGRAEADLNIKFLPIVADFSLTGDLAHENGFKHLTRPIDALLEFTKSLMIVGLEGDVEKLKMAKPAVKHFVEYYMIMDLLTRENRNGECPVLARTALLSMTPENIVNDFERQLFTEIHVILSKYATALVKADPQAKELHKEATVKMILCVNLLKIDPTETAQAGGQWLGDVVTDYINAVK